MPSVTQGAIVPIGADISGLKQGIQQAKAEVQNFSHGGLAGSPPSRGGGNAPAGNGGTLRGQGFSVASVGSAGEIAKGAIGQFGGPLSGFAGVGTIAGAGMAAAGAGIGFLGSSVQSARNARDQALAVSLSVGGYTRMARAASYAGIEQKDLNRSLEKFRDISFAASRGEQQSESLLASLGVDQNASNEQQMKQAALKISGMGARGNDMAAKLFGPNGAQIVRTINGGGSGGITGGAAEGLARMAPVLPSNLYDTAKEYWSQKLYDRMASDETKRRDNQMAATKLQADSVNRQRLADVAKFPGLLSPGEQYAKEAKLIAAAHARGNLTDQQAGRYLASAKQDYVDAVQPSGAAPSGGTDTAAGAALVLGAQRNYQLRQTRMAETGTLDRGLFGGGLNGISPFVNTLFKREAVDPRRQLFDGAP